MDQNEQIDLLLHWTRNVKRAQFGHYRMSHTYRHRYTVIGVTITIIAGVGGSAVIANLSKHFPQVATEVSIGVGFALLVAAVLSAIQTLLRLDERAQRHLTAATRYSAAKRLLGQLLATARNEILSDKRLDEIRKTLDGLSTEAPQIPDRVLKNIEVHMPPVPFEKYYPSKNGE